MKLIEPQATLIQQSGGIEGIYKQIELCSRTCYKSEDKITESSAEPFVKRMINSKHLSMLEHGTVYLYVKHYSYLKGNYTDNKYSVCNYRYPNHVEENKRGPEGYYITTNFRVLIENNWIEDIKYFCIPTEHHEKRYTIKFTTSIGITRELIRHRNFSIANESTRYCNYNKNKFNNEITFIKPYWVKDVEEKKFETSKDYNNAYELLSKACKETESHYNLMINEGYPAQSAREFLPLCTKSEICMTGFASDWRYFFDLRYYNKTGSSHPDMQILAEKAREEFIKAGIWDDIMCYSSKFD